MDDVDGFDELLVMPVDDEVLFPHGMLALVLPPWAALDVDAVNADDPALFLTRRPGRKGSNKRRDLYRVGTVARLLATRFPDGSTEVLAFGLARASVQSFRGPDLELRARVCWLDEHGPVAADGPAVLSELKSTVRRIVSVVPSLPEDLEEALMPIDDPWQLVDLIAANMVGQVADRQRVLETRDPQKRLELVRGHLARLERSFGRDAPVAPEWLH